ncbi:hypothetical protein M9Y10_033929 [Tritrichomonas musculus]|uniref:Protein kinase domain-containing protein n=1 Tax=Tritrichomonas musculus TaxID=1915356 RepID=A0ABR2KDJ0_9EUKA
MFSESRRYSLVTIVKVPEILGGEKKFRMINNYLLIKTIGHGSISKVFLGVDTEKLHLNEINNDPERKDSNFNETNICFDKCQLYAIKRISINELSRKSNALMQLEREIKHLRSFRHLNILKLHEVLHSTNDNYVYIVLEYADFGSLESILEKGHQFSLESIFSTIKQVADALKYIHSMGFVHQDIKPGNILLNSEGIALIADFGLGHSFQSAAMIVGSPAFQAPEALDKSSEDLDLGSNETLDQPNLTKQNSIEIDQEYNSLMNRSIFNYFQAYTQKINRLQPKPIPNQNNQIDGFCPQVREDVWALGVTLYQLLFGNLPFIGDNLYEIISNIKTKPLQIPPNSVSIELETLIRNMLAVNPCDRLTLNQVLEHPLIKNAPDRVPIHHSAKEGTIPLISKIDWKKHFLESLKNYEKIDCIICDKDYPFMKAALLCKNNVEQPKISIRPNLERRNSMVPNKNVISFAIVPRTAQSKTPLRCLPLKKMISSEKLESSNPNLLQFPSYTKE